MFLAYCIFWSLGVQVNVWTICLEHINLDVVYSVVLTT